MNHSVFMSAVILGGIVFVWIFSVLIFSFIKRHRRVSAEDILANNNEVVPSNRRTPLSPTQLAAKKLVSDNEIEFFQRLVKALPDYYIFPQVSLNAILKPKGHMSGGDFYSLWNQYNRLFADFVVCDQNTFQVVAIIELDDKSHDHKKEKDEKRDAMIKAAGYRLLRFQSKAKPSEQEIADLFRQKDKCQEIQ